MLSTSNTMRYFPDCLNGSDNEVCVIILFPSPCYMFTGSGRMDYEMMVELASSPPETFVMNATSIYDMQDLTQYLDNQTCSEGRLHVLNISTL